MQSKMIPQAMLLAKEASIQDSIALSGLTHIALAHHYSQIRFRVSAAMQSRGLVRVAAWMYDWHEGYIVHTDHIRSSDWVLCAGYIHVLGME